MVIELRTMNMDFHPFDFDFNWWALVVRLIRPLNLEQYMYSQVVSCMAELLSVLHLVVLCNFVHTIKQFLCTHSRLGLITGRLIS